MKLILNNLTAILNDTLSAIWFILNSNHLIVTNASFVHFQID